MQPSPIFAPHTGPMRVVFFASGGPGNLGAALKVEDSYPDLVRIEAVVTDRYRIPAICLASKRSRPVITRDFAKTCGPPHEKDYVTRRERVHDEILAELDALERSKK